MKLYIGDNVRVCKGKDRGKEGAILRILRGSGKVVVAGVNIRTLHIKPRTAEEKGSVEKREMPFDHSNVMLIDPGSKQQTRVGYDGSGREKKRVAKSSGSVLKHAPKKQRKTAEEKKV